MEDLCAYYFGVVYPDGSDAYSGYAENRARLWITYQLCVLPLQDWCFELDWIGV